MILDLDTWPRRSHYAFFREQAQPHFSLCAEVECTRLIEELKPQGVSPFNAILWSLMGAANAVPELRTRFRGEVVEEHERVHPSVTVPLDEEGFGFCSFLFEPEWVRFEARCREAVEAAKQKQALEEDAEGDAWIYLSCLPWLSFTSMTHPTNGAEDCMPRISWGRFARRGGTWSFPVSVQVHHALVDGVHLGHLYAGIQEHLNSKELAP